MLDSLCQGCGKRRFTSFCANSLSKDRVGYWVCNSQTRGKTNIIGSMLLTQHWTWSQQIGILTPALPHTSCVALGSSGPEHSVTGLFLPLALFSPSFLALCVKLVCGEIKASSGCKKKCCCGLYRAGSIFTQSPLLLSRHTCTYCYISASFFCPQIRKTSRHNGHLWRAW